MVKMAFRSFTIVPIELPTTIITPVTPRGVLPGLTQTLEIVVAVAGPSNYASRFV